jgi:hypothetical protein
VDELVCLQLLRLLCRGPAKAKIHAKEKKKNTRGKAKEREGEEGRERATADASLLIVREDPASPLALA